MADHIQISDLTPRKQYTADGVQTQFTYPFPIFKNTDLDVFLDETAQSVGYSISGAGQDLGGEVTFDTAPSAGTAVTLRRRLTIERTSDFQESGAFSAKVINDELDILTAALQQVADDDTRTVSRPATSTESYALQWPDGATTDPRVLTVSSDTGLEFGPATTEIVAAQVYAANAQTAQAAAESARTGAETAASNAGIQASAAASSATAAAAAAASNLFSRVSEKATGDSPYAVVPDTDDGTLFTVADDGNVTFALPAIATAGEGERYGFLRAGASHIVTLQRNGSDTINGVAADYTISAVAGEIILIVADDATPDNWVVIPWTQAAADETSTTKTGTTISVKDAGVTTAKLADGAVTAAKAAIASQAEAEAGTEATKLMTPQRVAQAVSALSNGNPSGAISMFGAATAPTGWLVCDGAAVSRTTYADLFAAIGTTWGAGDGSTTFNLPDLRGRAPIGLNHSSLPNGTNGSLSTRNLTDATGAETHTLTTAEMPVHSHTFPGWQTGSIGNGQTQLSNNSGGQHNNNTAEAGGGAAHNNMQPSVAVNFIIKT